MADPADRPGYSLAPGPPPEASRFFRNKGLKPAFSWADVEPEEHAVAFTVAKAMQIDVLTAIREEVQKAIDEGLPLEAFRKSLRPRLEALGWWGHKDVVDPVTGRTRHVQLGSPRRLRTIYDANLRSARAAGQWERIERTKRALPYLEYRLGPSEHHRPNHAIKEGLILPVDDPFWNEWMPPNGWGCKCWVKQIGKGEAERKGVDKAPKLLRRRYLNRRTGEMFNVPEGIDPGWDRNPGKLRAQAAEALLADKLEAADPDVARVAARDIASSWRAERVLAGEAPGAVPIGVLPEAIARAAGLKRRIVQTTSEYGKKFHDKDRRVTTAVLVELADALHDGIVLQDIARQGDLYVLSTTSSPWVMILKVLRDQGEVWVRSIYPLKANRTARLLADPSLRRLRD